MKKQMMFCASIFIASFLSLLSIHSRAQTEVAPVCTGGANCWKTVKPAEVNPVLWGNARCNDGTPGSYQIRPSPINSKTWVIAYEGGGSCDDFTSICSSRAKALTTTSVQSNNSWGKISHGGILSHKVENNPDFYNANLVLIDYCSSDLWSGGASWKRKNSATPNCSENDPNCGWYFSGRYNSTAAIASLVEQYGLGKDSRHRVMFVGTSAGGFGLAANAEEIKKSLASIYASDGMRFILEGSYMLEGWDEADLKIGSSKITSLNYVASENKYFWHATYESSCEADRSLQKQDPSLCALGSVFYPYLVSNSGGLGLKVLLQNSTLDKVAVSMLHLNSNADTRERWRCAMKDSLKQANWLFSSDEVYHTLATNNPKVGAATISDFGFKAGPTGSTLQEVVGRFWRNRPAERFFVKDSPCQ